MNYLLKLFFCLVIVIFVLAIAGIVFNKENLNNTYQNQQYIPKQRYIPKNPIEVSAYKQIGVVVDYDRSNGYYESGDTPKNTGVCTDTVIRALLDNGYNLKEKVFQYIKNFPKKYNDTPDKNINHKRVKNLLVFFKNNKDFASLPIEVNNKTMATWKAGDIITYKKLPKGLWHIGIVSGQKSINGVPMLIDNHGYGTQVRIAINSWPSDISGHFRLVKNQDVK